MKRIYWVDFLRGIAIILMLITHSARLGKPYTGDNPVNLFFSGLTRFFLLIEPYTFALFLFLAGFSLTILYKKNQRLQTKQPDSEIFLKNLFKRFLQLSLLSTFIFVMDKGFQWPAMITSSGPLLSIASTLLVLGFFLTLAPKIANFFLIATPLAAIVLATVLFKHGIHIPGVNIGPASVVCENVFGFYGAWFAFLYSDNKARARNLLLLLGLVFFIIGRQLSGSWTLNFPITYKIHYGNATIISHIKGIINGATPSPVQFFNWHYLASGLLMMLLPLSVSTFITTRIKNSFFEHKIMRSITLLGRHSLFAYVFHLIVISIFYVTSMRPETPVLVWIFIMVLGAFLRISISQISGRNVTR